MCYTEGVFSWQTHYKRCFDLEKCNNKIRKKHECQKNYKRFLLVSFHFFFNPLIFKQKQSIVQKEHCTFHFISMECHVLQTAKLILIIRLRIHLNPLHFNQFLTSSGAVCFCCFKNFERLRFNDIALGSYSGNSKQYLFDFWPARCNIRHPV